MKQLQRSRQMLESRLAELKATDLDAAAHAAVRAREASHVAAIQVSHAQQRAQYQATIAALQVSCYCCRTPRFGGD